MLRGEGGKEWGRKSLEEEKKQGENRVSINGGLAWKKKRLVDLFGRV